MGALQWMAITELCGSMLALSLWKPCTGLWSQSYVAVCWLSVYGNPALDCGHRAVGQCAGSQSCPWEPGTRLWSERCGAECWLSVLGSPTVNGGHKAMWQYAGSQSMETLHWIVVTELCGSVLALSLWKPCTGLWLQSCGAVCWLSVYGSPALDCGHKAMWQYAGSQSMGALHWIVVTELWCRMLALSPWEPCTGLWSQSYVAVCWLSVHRSPALDCGHKAMWQCAGSQSMGALHWIVVTKLCGSMLALSPWEPGTRLWSESCGAECWLSVHGSPALDCGRRAVGQNAGSQSLGALQ